MKTYRVNEIFCSIQGEGHRWGTVNVFVRFAGCNLQCNREEHGFDCDTEFTGGRALTAAELASEIEKTDTHGCRNIIWTGGEPSLQLDTALLAELPQWFHAIETNGTNELPEAVNWISCSPKSAEHTLRIERYVHELRYVRGNRQALPKPSLAAEHKFISPAFHPDGTIDLEAMRWCQNLVMENPEWRLSLQTHKLASPMR